MKFDSLLIRKKDSRPFAVRTAWGLVTAVCWVLYAYLWLPLLTLLLWLAGVHTATVELYLHHSRVEPFMLVVLPLLAVTAAVLVIAWAESNRRRFRGRERRKPTPNTSFKDVAVALGATNTVAASLQTGRVMTLRMDDSARPQAVSTHAGGGAVEVAI